MIPKILFIIFLVFTPKYLCRLYHNHTLYRTVPVNENQLNFLQSLTKKYDMNFWIEPGMSHKPCIFTISPEDHPSFINNVIAYGLKLKTIMDDVQSAFDQQTVKTYTRRQIDSFDWQNYYSLDDIYSWLKDVTGINPKSMIMKSIGKTRELRDIMAVSINLGNSTQLQRRSFSKKKVIIEGGIHAREWISPSFVTYFLNEIINAPSSEDAELKKIANLYEWHFIPILNPDGYEYSRTTDRLWRKNRRGGYGVDLNRNFEYGFGSERVNFDKSSELYCGPYALSEPESKSMSDFVRENANNLEYYISFHSFGQYFIIPYATSSMHMDNFYEVKLMSNIAAKRLKSRYDTQYESGTAKDTIGYLVSGISADWVKNSFRTRYVTTIELRDKGQYGFALPPRLILPTCLETKDAMLSFLTPPDHKWIKKMGNQLRNSQMRTDQNAVVVVFYVYLLFLI